MENEARLENLIRFARARSRYGALRLHEGVAYVRASAGGLRAVCVSPDAPLCELGRSSVKTVERALEPVVTALRARALPTAMAKRERRLQAYLIREALKQGGDLCPVLGAGVPFEHLFFALDEVPLHVGNERAPLVRCDVIAVGVNGSRLEPVLIELKWGRSLTRLREQLDAFSDLVERYRPMFATLLGEAIGRSAEVTADRIHQLIVWPAPAALGEADAVRGVEHTRRQLEEARITAIQFDDSAGCAAGYRFEAEWTAVEPARPRAPTVAAGSAG